MGGASFGGDDFRNSLKAYLEHNVYAFSGAKSFEMLQQFNKFLLDENGDVRPFAAFEKECQTIDVLYNKTYLAAEYDNAIASAQMAEKWEGLKAFKYLEYRTVGDDRVRPEHAVLDKLIAASTDPIWNRIYPPNAWRCRCTVVPAADTDTPTDRTEARNLEKSADIQPYFKINVGKSKVIYKDTHPYFKNTPYGKIKELDAEKNYGMRSIAQIYKTEDLPPIDYATSKPDALHWWMEQTGGNVRGVFDVKSADGLTVRFDNDFRNHVLEQNTDERFKILHKAPEVLKNPDEIWSRMVNGKPSLTYIKYYDKSPIIVQVDADGTVRSSTMVEMQHGNKINTAEMIKMRKGVLKFKQ